jgi:hypothetical protein
MVTEFTKRAQSPYQSIVDANRAHEEQERMDRDFVLGTRALAEKYSGNSGATNVVNPSLAYRNATTRDRKGKEHDAKIRQRNEGGMLVLSSADGDGGTNDLLIFDSKIDPTLN